MRPTSTFFIIQLSNSRARRAERSHCNRIFIQHTDKKRDVLHFPVQGVFLFLLKYLRLKSGSKSDILPSLTVK